MTTSEYHYKRVRYWTSGRGSRSHIEYRARSGTPTKAQPFRNKRTATREESQCRSANAQGHARAPVHLRAALQPRQPLQDLDHHYLNVVATITLLDRPHSIGQL